MSDINIFYILFLQILTYFSLYDTIIYSIIKGSVKVDTLLNEVNTKLQDLINNTDIENEEDIKRTKNYLSALLSHIDAVNKERSFVLTKEQWQILKRGNVV